MDKIARYRELIKRMLSEYADAVAKHLQNGVETMLVFDDTRDQYLWLKTGWKKRHRVYATTVHVRLKNDKIWIEQDWTEDGIATDLLREGVPNEDIVLGFCDPERRDETEFAVA
ncbi:hypothetical protein U14_03655 [Candidatus Moduliflexus flocculans]|uniref:XisI protein n=1 Tax=Candidatus Moduliflexus flocculans TaxID=1499966 RepID=A0A081BPT8_9BACT|nr:hypothetical protein U14_03655 [Candidatus Moduliflexus flocculans]